MRNKSLAHAWPQAKVGTVLVAVLALAPVLVACGPNEAEIAAPYQERVSKLEAELARTQGDLEDARESLESSRGELEASQTEWDEDRAGYEGMLEVERGKVASIEDELAGVREELQQLDEQYTEVSTRAESLRKDSERLQATLNTAQETARQLESQKGVLEDRHGTLEELNGEIERIREEIGSVETLEAEFKERIVDLCKQAADLRSKLFIDVDEDYNAPELCERLDELGLPPGSSLSEGVAVLPVLCTGSMYPFMECYDSILVTEYDGTTDLELGTAIAYRQEGTEHWILHRIIKVEPLSNGAVRYLAQGDANVGVDSAYVKKDDITHLVAGVLPFGMYSDQKHEVIRTRLELEDEFDYRESNFRQVEYRLANARRPLDAAEARVASLRSSLERMNSELDQLLVLYHTAANPLAASSYARRIHALLATHDSTYSSYLSALDSLKQAVDDYNVVVEAFNEDGSREAYNSALRAWKNYYERLLDGLGLSEEELNWERT